MFLFLPGCSQHLTLGVRTGIVAWAFLMKVINIEAGNLVNVTENMRRRRGDLAGLDLKEQKEQGPR